MSLQTRSEPQRRIDSPEPVPLIPAAQYVRMSDGASAVLDSRIRKPPLWSMQPSTILWLKTYADSGKSAVIAKNRPTLRELLKDVVGGNTEYKAILVYDVSRWGRFPNSVEAAHYELLCPSSGIPLRYCAEVYQ